MIRLTGVELRRGTKVLLESAEALINPGERIGLVGSNGAGKSSLMSVLGGESGTDAGKVDLPGGWTITSIAQEAEASEQSATDYVLDGDAKLRALEAELEHAHGLRIGELHEQLGQIDGYSARSRAQALLLGLGFGAQELEQAVAAFSGGWRMRLNLARALMAPADLLLLDEPTNHLDVDAIVWLEQWLQRQTCTMIIVSHDRDFLDQVCTAIVHIDQRKLRRYTGNYSDFERARLEVVRQNAAAVSQQQAERARLQRFVDRFKAKASKARQAQSRVKALERLQDVALMRTEGAPSFEFLEPQAQPDPALTLNNVVCGYAQEDGDAVRILNGVTFSLRGGQRLGLLGANGQGKSTLIKTLVGQLPALAGDMVPSRQLVIGYFAQHEVETLSSDNTALAHLIKLAPNRREQELRDFLGRFGFSGDMTATPVGHFSGGERARLALALLVWKRPNVLILDEPTNHLDLAMREVLTSALASFNGAVVLVSHDRALLRATVDELFLVHDGSVTPFDGDLDDYRKWLLARGRANDNVTSRPVKADRREDRKGDAMDRNERARARKPVERELQTLEKEMAKLNEAKSAVDQFLASEAAYLPDARRRLVDATKEQGELKARIASLEERWLVLQTEMETLA